MKFDDYYILKIDDLGYQEGYATFIWRDKTITSEDKLDLCIQLFEQKQYELESEKSPIDVWAELYSQFTSFEKDRLWSLYRKHLTSRKTISKLLILESILNDFANDAEFINETLVYEFGNAVDQQTLNIFIKFTEELPEETLDKLKTIITAYALEELIIDRL